MIAICFTGWLMGMMESIEGRWVMGNLMMDNWNSG